MKELGRLTLDERVGQLFMLGFSGASPDAESWARISRIRPAGLVLQQRNITSLDQVRELGDRCRTASELPLLIGVNQEGGVVDRFKHVLAPVPSPAETAANGLSAVRASARLIATELAAGGFNLNLAPVLDLGFPGAVHHDRTLGRSPERIGRLGRAVIEETWKKGILSCARHFPGMGRGTRDPHFVLPRIDRPRRLLFAEDMVPFNDLKDQLDMVMVGHGHYPTLGDLRPVPASLSPRVVGILRETVRFDGVVITDDLTMGAVTGLGLRPETFVRAIEAGNDIVQFSQATPLAEAGFQAVLNRAANDRNFRRRIDRSVERILDLKRRIPPIAASPRPSTENRIVRQIAKLRQSATGLGEVVSS